MEDNINNVGRCNKDRNQGVDALKAVCAFLIVCIHAPFEGIFGEYFVALCRCAVPIFFIITGFYYSDIVAGEKQWAQIRKMVVLIVGANVFYFLWKLVLTLIQGTGVNAYLSGTLTIKAILEFLFLNNSPFSDHLWYLGAILYVLIIVVICDKLHIRKLLYILTPILLICDLVFGKYSLALFGREFPYVLVRNFLFVGIPYFCIGLLLDKGKKRITHYIETHKNILYILVVVFCATTLLERFILVSSDLNSTRDHYISSTFLAITLFLCFWHSQGWHGRVGSIITRIGKSDSTLVYIVHPIFITILSSIAVFIGINSFYIYIRPIVVFACSVLCVELYQTCKVRMCIKLKKISR